MDCIPPAATEIFLMIIEELIVSCSTMASFNIHLVVRRITAMKIY